MQQEHGGDVRSYEIAYGQRPLDFSANVSPLGMPAGVRRAVADVLDRGAEYPDPLCRDLRQALGEHLGIPADWILCGNGASDLLYRLVLAIRPARALVTAPTFSEYEAALRLQGCVVAHHPLTSANDFAVTEKILAQITPELDMIFLCQPNNPTGRTIPRDLLLQILARCRETETMLVLDECFLEFLDDPEAMTLQDHLEGQPLIILRAFTKFYGMAGLRLGYCLSADTYLLERMRQAGPPWSVSSVAQAAGIAALEETEYTTQLRALILAQRPILTAGLQALGCHVIPGEANYLLFHAPNHCNHTLAEQLQSHGILIRDCRNYEGLEPGWYRIAVRTAEENRQFLATLQEILGVAPTLAADMRDVNKPEARITNESRNREETAG